jgi:hypothetical protein
MNLVAGVQKHNVTGGRGFLRLSENIGDKSYDSCYY